MLKWYKFLLAIDEQMTIRPKNGCSINQGWNASGERVVDTWKDCEKGEEPWVCGRDARTFGAAL